MLVGNPLHLTQLDQINPLHNKIWVADNTVAVAAVAAEFVVANSDDFASLVLIGSLAEVRSHSIVDRLH